MSLLESIKQEAERKDHSRALGVLHICSNRVIWRKILFFYVSLFHYRILFSLHMQLNKCLTNYIGNDVTINFY